MYTYMYIVLQEFMNSVHYLENSDDGVRNLFSRVGEVKKVFIPTPKAGQTKTYGFVTYGTIREAEQAMQKFNGFSLGSGVQLAVKVAEKQEDRDKRMSKKREEETFFKTLYCGKRGNTGENDDENEFEMNDKEDELNQRNPLMPHYNRSPSSPLKSTTSGAADTSEDIQPCQDNYLSSSAGASSLKASPMKFNSSGYDSTSPDSKVATSSPNCLSPAAEQVAKANYPKSLSPCIVCSTQTTVKCSRCHTPYCSSDCQKRDWPNHKERCEERTSPQKQVADGTTPPASTASEVPQNDSEKQSEGFDSGPLKLAENSDDDGFVINIPKDDDLELLNTFVHEVKSGRDPGEVLSHEEGESFKIVGGGDLPSKNEDDVIGFPNSSTVDNFTPQTNDMYSPGGVSNTARASQPTAGGVSNTSFPTDTPLTPSDLHTGLLHGETLNSPKGPFSGNIERYDSPASASSPHDDGDILIPISDISSHFKGLVKPLPSIPLTSPLPREFNAVVASIKSCTCFNALVMSVETKQAMLRLKAFADDVSNMIPVDAAELTQGSKCGYVTSDGEFFRVCVVGFPSSDLAQVEFQDCLVEQTVPTSSLYYLSEEILLIPSLSHVFSLLDLSSTRGSRFLEDLIRKEPVHIKKVRTVSLKHSNGFTGFDSQVLCHVESFDRTVNINDVVAQSLVVMEPQVSPHKSLDAFARSPTTVVSHTSTNITPNIASPSGQNTNYKLVHYAVKIPAHDIGGLRTFKFLPTVLVSPTVIWGQVMHTCIENLSRMQGDLNTQYQSTKNTSYTPTVGEICAAKFSQNQCYYRAEILCVNLNATIDICYVDFGNRDTVTTAQLRYLDPIYLSLPKQALLFSMAGISPPAPATAWSENSIAYLKDKIMNKKVEVAVVSKTTKSLLIKLFNPDCREEVLNDSMVLLGHAQRSSDTPNLGSRISSPLLSPGTPTSGLRGVSVHTKQVNTPAEDDDDSTVKKEVHDSQPARKQGDSEDALSTDKAKHLRSPRDFMLPLTPPGSPPEEDSGASKHAQPSASSGTNITQPSGIARLNDKESPISKNVASKVLLPTPSASIAKDVHVDDSCTPDHLSPQSPFGLGRENAKFGSEKPSSSGSLRPVKAMPTARVRFIETVQLPQNGSSVQVIVSHVENPLCFWVQIVDKSSLEQLMFLVEELNQSTLVQCVDARAGDLCACRSPEDSYVYRARIGSISNSHAKVQYIDYGNSENVPSDSVYVIEEKFLKVPAQAIMCSLNGLLNPAGRSEPWKEEAVKLFKSYFAADKTVSLTVTKCVGLKHIANLKVSEEGNEVEEKDILELFVKSGHGNTCTSKPGVGGTGNATCRSPDKRNFGNKRPNQLMSPPRKSPFGSKRGEDQQRSTFHQAKDQPQKVKSPFAQRNAAAGSQSSSQQLNAYSAASCSMDQKTKSPFAGLKQKMSSDQSAKMDSAKTEVTSNQGTEYSSSSVKKTSPFKKSPSPLKTPVEPSNPFQNRSNKPGLSSPAAHTKRPKVANLKKTTCPTDVDHFKVVVTEVESPQSIFVQIASEDIIKTLEDLFSSLSTYFASNHPSLSSPPPAIGDLVCAKFSEDGSWYRGEILAVTSNGEQCRVFFIDYGSTDDVVELSDMAECPAHLADVPAMAVKCALNGVAPLPSAASSSSWSPEAISFLQRKTSDVILQARVTGLSGRVSSCPALVELVDVSGNSAGVNLAVEMIAKGYAVSPVCNTSKASPSVSPEVVSKSLVVANNSSSSCFDFDLPSAKLPLDAKFRVQMVDITNPNEFRLQHIHNDGVMAMNALMEDLQTAYNGSDVHAKYGGFRPQIGAFCCAKYADDNCWYRCKVTAVSGANASILYVDFGNTESIPVSEIFSLDKEFSKLPTQAVLCSLSGVKPVSQTGWSSKAVECFQSLVSGSVQVLTAVVVVVVSESASHVAIELYFDKECTESVAQALIQAGNAVSSTLKNVVSQPEVIAEQNVSTSTTKLVSPHTITSSLANQVVECDVITPPVPLPLSALPCALEFKVLVVHVVSLTEFYLQVVTDKNVKTQISMMEEMNEYCSIAKGFSVCPAVGELCLAQYSDGGWLRAQVMKNASSPGSVDVFFFDYGNTESVALQLLKPMPEKFLGMPIQSVRCGLYGVPACDVVTPNDILETFKTMIGDNVFTCDVKSQVPLLVDLKDITSSSTLSVCDELVQMGLFPQPGLGMNSLTMNTLTRKDSSVVLVTDIKDPSNFWVQVLDTKSLSELEKILQKVNEHCGRMDAPDEPPMLGQLCCAKFSEDGMWYRAKIVEIISLMSYKVHFVDFGNSQERNLEHIRPFKLEFMYLQAQAVRCCLVGFEDGIVSSPSVVKKFRELCGDRKLVAINRGISGAFGTLVELVDTNGSEDVYVHKNLQ